MSTKELDSLEVTTEAFNLDIANGIVVLHNTYSGTYQMLQNFLIDYNEKTHKSDNPIVSIRYIDENNPAYKDLCDSFGKPNQATILILRNGKVMDILNSPINKLELIDSIQIFHK